MESPQRLSDGTILRAGRHREFSVGRLLQLLLPSRFSCAFSWSCSRCAALQGKAIAANNTTDRIAPPNWMVQHVERHQERQFPDWRVAGCVTACFYF
jgi:hypothetical protein